MKKDQVVLLKLLVAAQTALEAEESRHGEIAPHFDKLLQVTEDAMEYLADVLDDDAGEWAA